MSHRLGLRLVPDREVDDDVEGSGEAGQLDDERGTRSRPSAGRRPTTSFAISRLP